jgi:hypothetical protein
MKRIEIFANVSVQDALFEAFESRGIAHHYSIVPVIHGSGSSGPRHGDEVWPEENFMLVVYCSDTEAARIRRAVNEVKASFEDEGIRMFEIGA